MKPSIGVVIIGLTFALGAGGSATGVSDPGHPALAPDQGSSLIMLERASNGSAGCAQASVNPANSKTHDLDEAAADWGVYCEGLPAWSKANVAAPSLDGTALQCSITGGAPYSNVHCYRNLRPEPTAEAFILTVAFWFSATTCNNEGAPSIIQALEFTMNKWDQSKRYEFALQWQNVGDGAPQWRYWDPHRAEPDRWVPLRPAITHCLQGEQWHNLTLMGDIVDGQVHYQRFTIDGQSYSLDVTTAPSATPGESDRLALAVQLDGNFRASPYDVFVDNVNFLRKSASQVYLPLLLIIQCCP